ncbi:hypothetical protein CAPTEDRAFT_186951 [Capitella teleta]|uniref:Uncharacterized protein n=1 Tax=Capitella teleta TaxID=283909 RepID=R7TGG1_CAPTE|nr:hypothetical protein CAPTEDRAFT_186951 [Capitella teleta]|eukprot:ELT92582.1 hypothetical protein CAPTEDRAFT_186951 [Capitella teleta]
MPKTSPRAMAQSPGNLYEEDTFKAKSGNRDLRTIEQDLALLRHSIRRRSRKEEPLDPHFSNHNRLYFPDWGSPTSGSPRTPPPAFRPAHPYDGCSVCKKFKEYETHTISSLVVTPRDSAHTRVPSSHVVPSEEPKPKADVLLPREFLPGKVASPRKALRRYKYWVIQRYIYKYM